MPFCKVIREEHLTAMKKELVQKVAKPLAISEHHARILLSHYKWNVKKILELRDERSISYMFDRAGVIVAGNLDGDRYEPSSKVSCIVCREDVPKTEATTIDCGHYFCNECWASYFIVKMNEGPLKRIHCMSYECPAICDEAFIQRLLSKHDSELARKYDGYLRDSFVEDNKWVNWCPSVPPCRNSIRVEADDVLCEVECSCTWQFCFNCLSEVHSSSTCRMWELWKIKCQGGTATWIATNTMNCPSCRNQVEKNGGCNRINCRCGKAFCWICGGTITSVPNHSCGRYKNVGAEMYKGANQDGIRFMHYHKLYKAHADSLEQESGLKDSIRQKVATSRDYTWVTKGLNRLLRSRRALSLSYTFAYYMFGDELYKDELTNEVREAKQVLFEDQQQQFEGYVERLSKSIEEPFDEYNEAMLRETKRPVAELSLITGGLCKKMYEVIANDMLACLDSFSDFIAPCYSEGIGKAVELPAGDTLETIGTSDGSQGSLIDMPAEGIVDIVETIGTSDGTGYSPRKRGRTGLFQGSLIDMPAESKGEMKGTLQGSMLEKDFHKGETLKHEGNAKETKS